MKGRIQIEAVEPSVDGGRWPAKSVVGEPVTVRADVFRDGHEPLRAVLRHRPPGERTFTEVPMVPLGNDAWEAAFTPVVLGRHQFTVAAWSDPFDYWRHRALTFTETTPDDEVEVELQGAGILLKERLDRAQGEDPRPLDDAPARLHPTPPLQDPPPRAPATGPRAAPALGTIDDFDPFVAAAGEAGLEVALDFAIQCSPDHPWVREHPDFFLHRADGSIRYAENPPKKYQDIYPINWDGPHVDQLYQDLLDT